MPITLVYLELETSKAQTSSLTSKPSQKGKRPVQWETCLKVTRQRAIEEDTWYPALVSAFSYTGVCIWKHRCTHIRTTHAHRRTNLLVYKTNCVVSVCLSIYRDMHCSMCVKVKQLATRVGSLLPPDGSLRLNSDPQAWRQASLSTGISWRSFYFDFCSLNHLNPSHLFRVWAGILSFGSTVGNVCRWVLLRPEATHKCSLFSQWSASSPLLSGFPPYLHVFLFFLSYSLM